jgi:hypothetical protein
VHTLLRDRRALAERVRAGHLQSLIDDAVRDGVDGLLAFAAGAGADPLIDAERRRLALRESVAHAEMVRVTEGLSDAGLRAAILKGGALAYTHYPEPWCRPRIDLDLLVSRADRDRSREVMRALGYREGRPMSSRWLMQQDAWKRQGGAGVPLDCDVHFELTNRQFFAAKLPVQVLLDRSVPAPFAGRGARQLDAVDALIYSCVHRIAHHSHDARLIWHADIARQGAALDAAAVACLVDRARAAGLASVAAQELRIASALWDAHGGALAPGVIRELSEAGRREPAKRFLAGGRGPAGDLWLDLQSLSRWSDRAGLLAELLFPTREYMLRQPGVTPGNLPWRYVRRYFEWPARWFG